MKTARGYRRVDAPPRPTTMAEKWEIRKLIDMGFVVMSCGGGGIPVIREGRTFHCVDAVIGKDLAGAKPDEEVGVDIFLIATDVEGVALAFGTPNQEFLRKLTLAEAEQYLAGGEFPPGSMCPKVQTCLRFLQKGGKRAIITTIDQIEKAIAGEAGTEVTR